MSVITDERAKLAAVSGAPRLRRREECGFKGRYTNSRPVTAPATRVFIHITITNPRSYSSDDAHARAVEAIGLVRFPATGVSYNRLFMLSARAYEGQPMGRRGAHTVNDHKRSRCSTSGCPGRGSSLTATDSTGWNLNYNARAYAVCALTSNEVSSELVDLMARAIVADMRAGLVSRDASLHGHRCVSSKSCPGDEMWTWMDELARLVDYYLAVGLGGTDPEEDDMTPEQDARLEHVETMLEQIAPINLSHRTQVPANTRLLISTDLQPIRAALAELTGREVARVDEAELARELAAVLVPAVLAELDGVDLDEAAMERVIRRVLGGLDEPQPTS